MERPIKVNFPHQTRWDEINDKLWADFETVESYKQMWHNAIANHISQKERDKLFEQLQEKLDDFHYDFLYGCQQIIEYVIDQYIGKLKTTQVLCMLEEELKNNLMTFVNNWKQYISSPKALKLLLEELSYDDICKLRYPKYSSFILDNCNDEITINTAIIWETIFNYLDMPKNVFIKQIDDNVTFYL